MANRGLWMVVDGSDVRNEGFLDQPVKWGALSKACRGPVVPGGLVGGCVKVVCGRCVGAAAAAAAAVVWSLCN